MKNRQCSKLVSKMFGKVAALGGQDFQIVRDSLRFRYGYTHRYNFNVLHNDDSLESIKMLRAKIIDDLHREGWHLIKNKKGNPTGADCFMMIRNGTTFEIRISPIYDYLDKKFELRMGAY